MITTIASIFEQVTSGLHLQLFLLFTLAIWGVWAYKLWLSRSYRPIEGSFSGTVTILIPTFREVPERLRDAIASALRQEPLEVIVVVDEREPQTRTDVIQSFGDQVRTIVAPAGKRRAVAAGVQEARGDIVMVTASDVLMEEDSVQNLVAAFSDPRVGGVCGYTRAITVPRNLASLIFFGITEMRTKLTYRALGASRQVHVLDGECFAVRREYWQRVIDRYLNQRFMGVQPISGDDGWITTLLLEDGWQTAYQENARVHTYAPTRFGELIRQQLRWTRNSVRRSWYVITRGIAFRTGLPFTIHTFAYLFKAPVFAALLILTLGRTFGLWQLGGGSINSTELVTTPFEAAVFSGGIAGMAVLVTGLVFTTGIRALPRYQKRRLMVDLLLVPVYAVIGLLVLMPLRLYGIMTARRINWGTRGGGVLGSGSVIHSASTVLALAAALTIPVGLLALVGLMASSPFLPTATAVLAAGSQGFLYDWDY